MSMPQFPCAGSILTREEAVNAIMTSIALEETALSHILNAEGEKIQYALAYVTANTTDHSLRQLLDVNKSVAGVLEQINDMQTVLKNKMHIAKNYAPAPEPPPEPDTPVKPVDPNWQCPPCCPPSPPPCPPPCPPKPPCPPDPPHPPYPCPSGCQHHYHEHHHHCYGPPCPEHSGCQTPCCPPPPCTAVLSAVTEYAWCCASAMPFKEVSGCTDNVKLCRNNGVSQILLSAGKKYIIEPVFDLINKEGCPVSVSIELCCGDEPIHTKEFSSDKYHVHFTDLLVWDVPADCRKGILTVRLLSPQKLTITCGELIITEFRGR